MAGRAYTNIAAAAVGDADRFVTSVAMKVGAYALAVATMPDGPKTGRHVTCTRTVVGGADTAGTLAVVGKNLSGQTITETLTPGAHGILVTGTKWFSAITSVTGAGWVTNTGDDTIVVGVDGNYVAVAEGSGVLHAIVVNTTAAGSITLADSSGTIAVLKASIAEGTYTYDVAFSGYLRCELAGASDVTVIHSGSIPDYAVA